MIVDRYERLGLIRNPFAVLDGARNEHAVFVDRGLPAPPAPGSATFVQLIGEKGAGKTSQVQAWRRSVDGPYHYVPPAAYRDRWNRPPVEPLVYADEVDRMPWPLRRWWLERLGQTGATVVAGTHTDLGRIATRAGLRVVTHVLAAVDVETLRSIIDRRFEVATVPGSQVPLRLDEQDVAWIHEQSGGSIRIAERYGHELVAERVHKFDSMMNGVDA